MILYYPVLVYALALSYLDAKSSHFWLHRGKCIFDVTCNVYPYVQCAYVYVTYVMRVCTYVCVCIFVRNESGTYKGADATMESRAPMWKRYKICAHYSNGNNGVNRRFQYIYVLIFCSSFSFSLSFIFHVVHNTQSVIWSDWENSVQKA